MSFAHPLSSQNSGARQLARIAGLCALSWNGLLIRLAIYLLMLLASPWIVSAFSEQAEVQRLLLQYLWILPLGYGLQGVIILTNSSLNALHQPRLAGGVCCVFCAVCAYFVRTRLWLWTAGSVYWRRCSNLLGACLAYLWFNSTLRRLNLESV